MMIFGIAFTAVMAGKFLDPFMKIPAYADDPGYYSDWGDVREFTSGDLGVGECAGEVVTLFGKASMLHVREVLRTTRRPRMHSSSVARSTRGAPWPTSSRTVPSPPCTG